MQNNPFKDRQKIKIYNISMNRLIIFPIEISISSLPNRTPPPKRPGQKRPVKTTRTKRPDKCVLVHEIFILIHINKSKVQYVNVIVKVRQNIGLPIILGILDNDGYIVRKDIFVMFLLLVKQY